MDVELTEVERERIRKLKMQRDRIYRHALSGRCTKCGKRKERRSKYRRCADCRAKLTAHAAKARDKYRAAGRCFRCGGEKVDGLCPSCCRQQKLYRLECQELGICSKCYGRKAEPGFTRCPKCREAERKYQRRRAAKVI